MHLSPSQCPAFPEPLPITNPNIFQYPLSMPNTSQCFPVPSSQCPHHHSQSLPALHFISISPHKKTQHFSMPLQTSPAPHHHPQCSHLPTPLHSLTVPSASQPPSVSCAPKILSHNKSQHLTVPPYASHSHPAHLSASFPHYPSL